LKLSTWPFCVGLPGLDEVELHAVLESPAVERRRDELRPVVDAQRLGQPV
jgi:hypothetical protein